MAISVPIVSTWDATGIDKSIRDIQKAEGGWAKAGAGVKAAAVPAAAALGALSVAGFGAVKAAEESARANAGLEQVLKSMGFEENIAATKAYADELSRLTGIDDEAIITAQTKLATFSEVAKSTETMGQATKIAADLSAAGFGSMDSAAVMLGKALQDPIKGIGALSRVGVTFTEEEKKMVAEMVKAGDAAGAQALIMGALETQVGGVAESTATDSAKMATAWGNLTEEIGEKLLPMFSKLTDGVLEATDFFSEHSTVVLTVAGVIAALSATILVINGAMKAYSAAVTAANVVIDVMRSKMVLSIIQWAKNTAAIVANTAAAVANRVALLATQAAMLVVRTATMAWTAAQWLLNAALTANPIGLVIAAIALLVGAIVLAYKKSDTFRAIVDALWQVLKNSVVGAFKAVSSAISTMVDWLKKAWDWVQKLIDKISNIKMPSLGGFDFGGIFGRSTYVYSGAGGPTTYLAPSTRGYVAGGAVNIYLQGSGYTIEDARVIKRALEGYDVGQGRPIGAPLAKSW